MIPTFFHPLPTDNLSFSIQHTMNVIVFSFGNTVFKMHSSTSSVSIAIKHEPVTNGLKYAHYHKKI